MTTTHILRVEVPLDLTNAATFDYHPVEEALRAVLAISRLAADGCLAGDFQITMRDYDPAPDPPAVAQDFTNSGIAVAERPQGVEAWPDDVEMAEMCCCGHTLGQHAYGADRAVCDQPDGRCDCLDFHQDYQHPPAQPDRASDSYHSYHSGNRP